MKRLIAIWVALSWALSLPVSAADLGGSCCADLETRIAELEATAAVKGTRKVTLSLSGQVNEAILWFDDGAFQHTYVGGNNNSTSRILATGKAAIDAEWSAGYTLELGTRNDNSNTFNQKTDAAQGTIVDIIRSAWYVSSKTYGLIRMGKWGQVTDGIANYHLENTSMVTSSTSDLTMGGFFLRNTGKGAGSAQLSALRYTDLIPTGGDFIAGQARRANSANTVHYEGPEIFGFSPQVSWGQNDVWAVALKYAAQPKDFRLAAGIGYTGIRDVGYGASGCANLGAVSGGADKTAERAVDCTSLGMSASAIHTPTGLFVSGQYGINHDNNRAALFHALTGVANTSVADIDWSWAMSAGIEKNFFGIGTSTFYGEFTDSHGGAGLASLNGSCSGLGGAAAGPGLPKPGQACALLAGDSLNPLGTFAFVSSTQLREWGLGYVQSVDATATDLYIAFKHFDPTVNLSKTGGQPGSVTANTTTFATVQAGALIKF